MVFKKEEYWFDYGELNDSFPIIVFIDFLVLWAEFQDKFFLESNFNSAYKIYWKGFAIVIFSFSHFLMKLDVDSLFLLLEGLDR